MKKIKKTDDGDALLKLMNQSPAVMLIIKAGTGEILHANQAAINYYGYLTDELLSMRIFDLNVGDRSSLADNIKEIKATGHKVFQSKHRHKNGDVRDVEIFSGVINYENNISIHSIIVDVTNKVQLERELEKNCERMELVIAGAEAGIWDYDLVNNSATNDQRWKAILGYEDHELNGGAEDWQKSIHPDDIDRVNRAVQESLAGKTNEYQIEHRMRHKDGSYRWVSSKGKIVFNETMEPIRAVGTIIDITRVKEIEERISENEKKLRNFAQAIPNFSAIVDEDGRYIEVFGDNKVLLQELADSMTEDIRQTLLTGENRSVIREINFGNVKRYFESRSVPMHYPINGKRTVAVFLSDITEWIEIDKVLKFKYELQRKSDFIDNILNGNLTQNEKTVSMAREFGIDLNLPLYCCLLHINNVPEEPIQKKRIQNQKNQLLYFMSSKTNCLVWDNQDKIGVICNSKDFQSSEGETVKSVFEIKKMISEFNPNLPISMGVSDVQYGSDSIQKSYREAWNTLLSAQYQDRNEGGIYYYRDIGLFQILTNIYRSDNTFEFVQKMLGPLIEYDLKKGSDFLVTLEEILQSNNMKDAANRLFVHQKTLNYRKQRIEKILGMSLDNFDTRLALGTAFKLHKMNSMLLK
ncbi:PAS domain S-box [Desulfosporosinus acidiphilus SJ4]|uniref:histidine kinase n=1 Tax=Desulfosporosinus acidiphilus (strain DSM 22704 / JCM 16185 / SJ4) TaxID=646529 RepID=I4D3Z1_DESAJ|nr:PAS domain S-box protein [Desulfosporosinus acidiphilus]AFM40515.1 PAS domain S-box [Desulfosporosinus acidiphilus SJ4]